MDKAEQMLRNHGMRVTPTRKWVIDQYRNENQALSHADLESKANKEIDSIDSISAATLQQKIAHKQPVFDVRKPGEYDSEHIKVAENTPLDYLNDYIEKFPKSDNFYIHCAGGYRSVIAASILKARGFHNVVDIAGGFAAIKNTDIERTDAVCPSTLK